MNQEDIAAGLRQQQQSIEQLQVAVKKMERHLLIMRIMNTVRFIIILIPIILAVIYLPPVVEDMLRQWGAVQPILEVGNPLQ